MVTMSPRHLILTFSTLALMALQPACTVVRKIERWVPEIPDIVLIGQKDKSPRSPTDPGSLTPDLEKDAAVLRIRGLGKTHRVVIQLYPASAPITVANFQEKIRRGHYEGMAVHRTIPIHLIQMGDPQSREADSRAAWGTGGLGSTLPAEIHLPHRLGAVGMARLGDALNPARESSESQFYIALGDLSSLNGRYTVFGQVMEGYEGLQALSEAAADENDNPYQRLEIVATSLDEARKYTPEDITGLHRSARRNRLEASQGTTDGLLKRTWRRIW